MLNTKLIANSQELSFQHRNKSINNNFHVAFSNGITAQHSFSMSTSVGGNS